MLNQSPPLLFGVASTNSYNAADKELSIEDLPEEQSASMLHITDAQAEKMLPGYPIAFEAYHVRRTAGASPEEALVETLDEWRSLWNNTAYVPHRRK